jgi:hypothetical protein
MHASNRACRLLSAIGFCLTATLAQAVGLRSIDIPADAAGPAIHGMIWYPCARTPGEIRVDCPLAGEHLPLIADSHGQGATLLVNHDTAETFADNGFIVAAISHPGDTAQDPINQLGAQVLPDEHPAMSQLNSMFGEHTFFVDEMDRRCSSQPHRSARSARPAKSSVSPTGAMRI